MRAVRNRKMIRTRICRKAAGKFLCGIAAGLLIRIFYKEKPFFNFSGFDEPKSRDTDPNLFWRLLKNIGRNIKATGFWFLIGIMLSALFQRYVPAFMITGPVTKITNLGAVKIVLGMKRFLLYLAFVMAFSLITGSIVNLII